MKALIHPASTAFGLAVLCCLVLIAPVTSPDHLLIFHDSGRPAAIFLPLLADLAIVWLAITLVLLRARRPGRVRVAIWSGVILVFPWLLLEDGGLLNAWTVHRRVGVPLFLWSCLCWVVVNVFWRSKFLPAFERLVSFWKTAFAFLAVNNVVVVCQLLWCFWGARDIDRPRPLYTPVADVVAASQARHTRVIWIILDELSYRQVYERRFPSLQLPAFDQLASESTVFTQVSPAGVYTEQVVPSLLTGIPVDSIKPATDGVRFSMHDPVRGEWVEFRQHDTIFQDALDDGYRTAVTGWYNPYCRILPEVLNRCFWVYRGDGGRGIFAVSTPLENTVGPFLYAASHIVSRRRADSRYTQVLADAQIADFRDLYASGDRMLADPSLNFLLLHLPAPHPGGVYDRRNDVFDDDGRSYIDNLALADRYLAHVRTFLKQRGEWDSSAVVVMGDHSWRTFAWKETPRWTAEDQLASDGGRFDDRPAYIVKLPGQTGPERINTPYAALNTHAMLQRILNGEIRTPGDLAAFVQASPAPRIESRTQGPQSVALLAP